MFYSIIKTNPFLKISTAEEPKTCHLKEYKWFNIWDQSSTKIWNAHVDYVCMSLVKFFGIFNHVKHFVSKQIARQLYFSFIYSRINYGIEVYGSCADEHLSKLQVMQNKLLKLLLKLDYHTSTNLLHFYMALLKLQISIMWISYLSWMNLELVKSGYIQKLFHSARGNLRSQT